MQFIYGAQTQVTAGEIARNFGRWQDQAMAGPVVITHHGRARVVLVSAAKFSNWAEAGQPGGPSVSRTHAIAMDHMQEGFASLDGQLQIAGINRVFEDMAGLDASEIAGQRWTDVFPATSAVFVEQVRQCVRTGEAAEFDSDGLFGHPSLRYQVRVFRHADGVALFFRNRTPDDEVRERERAGRAALSALIALPGHAMVWLNVRGYFTEIDESFLRLTGFQRHELRGARLADLITSRDRRPVGLAFEAALQSGLPQATSAQLIGKELDPLQTTVSAATIGRVAAPEGLAVVIARA